MTISEIEQSITKLSPNQLTRFRAWFTEFDSEAWDQQFVWDATSGKFDKLAEKAITDSQPYPACAP